MGVRLGVEVFLGRKGMKGKRWGLLTVAPAVTRGFVPSVDALRGAGFSIIALFAPEHGFYGALGAGEKVTTGYDEKRKLPIFSLYGETLKPLREWLEGLDGILVDLPDVGCRFYTYAWTMSHLMEAAGEVGLPIFVLDRPNPINGVQLEGKGQQEIVGSLIGRFPIPIRHGMTLGEVALWLARNFLPHVRVEVIPCEGWRRAMWWDETGLPWVSPSPAMATLTTATLYPGTCLLEGTNLSEGRGTVHPFEWVGAPFLDEEAFAETLNRLALPGVFFRPIRFIPFASKHAGQICRGVQIHITDRNAFRPVRVGLCLLGAAKKLAPDEFSWRPETIDRHMGTKAFREAMDETDDPLSVALEWDLTPDAPFEGQRKDVLCYP